MKKLKYLKESEKSEQIYKFDIDKFEKDYIEFVEKIIKDKNLNVYTSYGIPMYQNADYDRRAKFGSCPVRLREKNNEDSRDCLDLMMEFGHGYIEYYYPVPKYISKKTDFSFRTKGKLVMTNSIAVGRNPYNEFKLNVNGIDDLVKEVTNKFTNAYIWKKYTSKCDKSEISKSENLIF